MVWVYKRGLGGTSMDRVLDSAIAGLLKGQWWIGPVRSQIVIPTTEPLLEEQIPGKPGPLRPAELRDSLESHFSLFFPLKNGRLGISQRFETGKGLWKLTCSRWPGVCWEVRVASIVVCVPS